eukprot:TRINITY_DN20768_c0_g1_i2.p1 TRINITY_DN20768_c0_g1~~TRINITY_DN20768_c0_g1_i2.p1  ORF type:complete len:434 (-),score=82.86 TRINITY_DN20768_c0_g1_i2:31-1332(-)
MDEKRHCKDTDDDDTLAIKPYISNGQFDIAPAVVSEFFTKFGGEKFYRLISQIINDDGIAFPLKKHFIGDPKQMFQNLKHYKANIAQGEYFRVTNVHNGTGEFWKLFPTKYRPVNAFVLIRERDWQEEYDSINVMSDYYFEKERMQSVGFPEEFSPWDHWKQRALHDRWLRGLFMEDLAKDAFPLNSRTLRERLYKMVKEARQGKPTVYSSMIQYLGSRRIFDNPSGWGDRLLAAMACDVDKWVGVDCNPSLREGYSTLITEFAPDQSKYVFRCERIEECDLGEDLFDLVMISPAPFQTETYNDPTGQATNAADYYTWLVDYLFVTVRKSWAHLEKNGKMAITVLDRLRPVDKKLYYTEVLNLYCQYKLAGAVYYGVIGWMGSRTATPWWMWCREDPIRDQCDLQDRTSRAEKLLQEHYPEVFQRIKDQPTVL